MRFPFIRRPSLIREPENAVARKESDTYATRSRCPSCKEFVIEGREHTCPRTGVTKQHENPSAPKPKPEERK